MLTNKDLQQITSHGLTLDEVVKQLETFSRGIPYANIVRPASIGNGIQQLEETERKRLIAFYDEHKQTKDIVKFVPASGAATRMFKFLYTFLENYNPEEEPLNTYIKQGNYLQLKTFLNSLKELPFVNDVRKKIRALYPDFKHHKKGMRS